MSKSTTQRPEAHWALLSERFVAALLAGDEAAAQRPVVRLHSSGVSIRQIVHELFVPAAVAVGEGWAAGRVSVAEEHRASEIATRLLGALNPRVPGRRRGTAVVATCQDEHHTLPTTMAAMALREDRWNVEHLGSGVPARGLVRFAQDANADLVVLSVTVRELIETSRSFALALEREGFPVLVGGPGRTLEELCDLAVHAVSRR